VTTVHNVRDYWVIGLCASSGILKNTAFRKLCFRSQVKWREKPTLLDPYESEDRKSPVSETSCSLEY
jgi:hypothetical protein